MRHIVSDKRNYLVRRVDKRNIDSSITCPPAIINAIPFSSIHYLDISLARFLKKFLFCRCFAVERRKGISPYRTVDITKLCQQSPSDDKQAGSRRLFPVRSTTLRAVFPALALHEVGRHGPLGLLVSRISSCCSFSSKQQHFQQPSRRQSADSC